MPIDHTFLESIDLFAELDPQMRKSIAAHFETLRITGGLPSGKSASPLKQVSGSPCGLTSKSLRRDAFFPQGPPGGTFFRDFMT
jgi:hypothetical protein